MLPLCWFLLFDLKLIVKGVSCFVIQDKVDAIGGNIPPNLLQALISASPANATCRCWIPTGSLICTTTLLLHISTPQWQCIPSSLLNIRMWSLQLLPLVSERQFWNPLSTVAILEMLNSTYLCLSLDKVKRWVFNLFADISGWPPVSQVSQVKLGRYFSFKTIHFCCCCSQLEYAWLCLPLHPTTSGLGKLLHEAPPLNMSTKGNVRKVNRISVAKYYKLTFHLSVLIPTHSSPTPLHRWGKGHTF